MTISIGSTGSGGQVLINGVPALEIGILGGITAPCVTGLAKGLVLSTTGLNAVVTVAADELVVGNNGFYKNLKSIAVAPSLAVSGVNGLDTGVSAISTWYYVFVIWNGSVVAGLLSSSPTAPLLPSGYTYFARVGSVRTDATGNKFPFPIVKLNNQVRYKPAAGTNLTTLPRLISGASGSPVTPTWTAVAWASAAPPTATVLSVNLYAGDIGTANTGAAFAPNNSYGPGLTSTSPPILSTMSGGINIGTGVNCSAQVVPESANLYYASNVSLSVLSIYGYEDPA